MSRGSDLRTAVIDLDRGRSGCLRPRVNLLPLPPLAIMICPFEASSTSDAAVWSAFSVRVLAALGEIVTAVDGVVASTALEAVVPPDRLTEAVLVGVIVRSIEGFEFELS